MRSLLVVVVVVFALLLGACADRVPPTDEVVLCDRSSSAAICDETVVRRAGGAFLDINPPPGSRFVVLVVGCSVEDVSRQYEIRVPERWGRGAVRKRRHWQEVERKRLANLTLPSVNQCSAVSAGIWRTARVFAERPGTNQRFILVSDLREVNRPLGINFERKVSAPADFVGKLRKARLLADLSGVQTSVCGVHDRATPDAPTWTARRAQQLHLAWNSAFAAMGIPDIRLTESCDFEISRNQISMAGRTR